MFTRRKALGLLLAGSAAYAATYPYGTPAYDETLVREPNEYQKAFIKKLAPLYDYLCFGDTDHRRELSKFVLGAPMLDTLAATGITRVMMEYAPRLSHLFDPGMPRKKFLHICASNLVPAWTCGRERKENVCRILDEAITNGHDIRLVPVDRRFETHSIEGPPGGQRILLIPFSLALTASLAFHGCVDEPIFELAKPFMDEESLLLDDRATVEAIQGLSKPSAIFYGAGHFKRSMTQKSIANLLEQAGQALCILNVYESLGDAERIDTPGDMPDVQLCMVKPGPADFTDPKGEAEMMAQKTGIYVRNHLLLPMLEEVIAEVDGRPISEAVPAPQQG